MKAIWLRVIGSICWLILLYAITDTKLCCLLLLSNLYYYRCDDIPPLFLQTHHHYFCTFSRRACRLFPIFPPLLPSIIMQSHPPVTLTHSSPPGLLFSPHTLSSFSLHPWSTFSCCSDYFAITFSAPESKENYFFCPCFLFSHHIHSSFRSTKDQKKKKVFKFRPQSRSRSGPVDQTWNISLWLKNAEQKLLTVGLRTLKWKKKRKKEALLNQIVKKDG